MTDWFIYWQLALLMIWLTSEWLTELFTVWLPDNLLPQWLTVLLISGWQIYQQTDCRQLSNNQRRAVYTDKLKCEHVNHAHSAHRQMFVCACTALSLCSAITFIPQPLNGEDDMGGEGNCQQITLTTRKHRAMCACIPVKNILLIIQLCGSLQSCLFWCKMFLRKTLFCPRLHNVILSPRSLSRSVSS